MLLQIKKLMKIILKISNAVLNDLGITKSRWIHWYSKV